MHETARQVPVGDDTEKIELVLTLTAFTAYGCHWSCALVDAMLALSRDAVRCNAYILLMSRRQGALERANGR